jgi:hypothetical protein
VVEEPQYARGRPKVDGTLALNHYLLKAGRLQLRLKVGHAAEAEHRITPGGDL